MPTVNETLSESKAKLDAMLAASAASAPSATEEEKKLIDMKYNIKRLNTLHNKEMLSFVVTESGKMQAEEGSHDVAARREVGEGDLAIAHAAAALPLRVRGRRRLDKADSANAERNARYAKALEGGLDPAHVARFEEQAVQREEREPGHHRRQREREVDDGAHE